MFLLVFLVLVGVVRPVGVSAVAVGVIRFTMDVLVFVTVRMVVGMGMYVRMRVGMLSVRLVVVSVGMRVRMLVDMLVFVIVGVDVRVRVLVGVVRPVGVLVVRVRRVGVSAVAVGVIRFAMGVLVFVAVRMVVGMGMYVRMRVGMLSVRLVVVSVGMRVRMLVDVLVFVIVGVDVRVRVLVGVVRPVSMVMIVGKPPKMLNQVIGVIIHVRQPAVIGVRAAVQIPDVGFDVQNGRPIENVHAVGVEHVTLHLDHPYDVKTDGIGTPGRTRRPQTDLFPLGPGRRDLHFHGFVLPVQKRQNDGVTETVEIPQPGGVFGVQLDPAEGFLFLNRLIRREIAVEGRANPSDGRNVKTSFRFCHGRFSLSHILRSGSLNGQ